MLRKSAGRLGSIWDTTKFKCVPSRSSLIKSPALMCAELARPEKELEELEELDPTMTPRQQWALYMRRYRRRKKVT